ncbi:MAG: hypothetical protein KH544_06745 [Firmicutes bacterium]|nr:hypothetical protein [Bacillota bacterium]
MGIELVEIKIMAPSGLMPEGGSASKKASQSLPPAGGKEIKSFSLATCA